MSLKMKSKPKIYILGAFGYLGGVCTEYFKGRGYKVITNKVDITDLPTLEKVFKKIKPDVVINFAGVRVTPNVDWCEDHKEETIKVNVVGAINAMTAAIDCGAYPIQISSGCVYSGGKDKKFTETDAPNFFGSFYSRARIILENSLLELPVLYARIRMPVSTVPHPRNTISKIISYKRVISDPNSVTVVEDLGPALEKIIKIKPLGVLNLTNEGYIEHKDILDAYKKVIDPDHTYELISHKELERSVTKARRSSCLLSTKKAKSLGVSLPTINKKRLIKMMEGFKKTK